MPVADDTLHNMDAQSLGLLDRYSEKGRLSKKI